MPDDDWIDLSIRLATQQELDDMDAIDKMAREEEEREQAERLANPPTGSLNETFENVPQTIERLMWQEHQTLHAPLNKNPRIREVQKEDRKHIRKKNQKADWDDDEDVNTLRRERREKQRLKQLPPSRICPECKNVVPNPNNWVIKPGVLILCRSCFHSKCPDIPPELRVMMVSPFQNPVVTFEVNAVQLDNYREQVGMSVALLCGSLGVTPVTYYNRLNKKMTFRLDDRHALKVRELFKVYGLVFDDQEDTGD
jgi:hypothetical protein